jgi:hypothetical protein
MSAILSPGIYLSDLKYEVEYTEEVKEYIVTPPPQAQAAASQQPADQPDDKQAAVPAQPQPQVVAARTFEAIADVTCRLSKYDICSVELHAFGHAFGCKSYLEAKHVAKERAKAALDRDVAAANSKMREVLPPPSAQQQQQQPHSRRSSSSMESKPKA